MDKPSPESDIPDFGFTFVISKSSKLLVHTRTVYTVLEFLGDVGGLDGSLVMILSPLLSLFSGSLFKRKLLNSKFKYDDSKPIWQPSSTFANMIAKKHPYSDRSTQQDAETGLVNRIKNAPKLIINRADLMSMKGVYVSLKAFKVGICEALTAD